jgi:NAD(P)-dependent dehydrogenase (short-subunit alcohol dehydrogenase family)
MEEIDLETFQSVMNVNVTASFQCAQEAIRIMKAQTPQGGRSVPLATTFDPSLMQDSIINNGSISAYVPRALSTVYTMSKHAILGMTKCIALDYREYSIACSQIDIGTLFLSQLPSGMCR